jgi:hypothetical protein
MRMQKKETLKISATTMEISMEFPQKTKNGAECGGPSL